MWKDEVRVFFKAIAAGHRADDDGMSASPKWPTEALWIRGPSGSGKTFCVHELAREYAIDVIACDYVFCAQQKKKKRQRYVAVDDDDDAVAADDDVAAAAADDDDAATAPELLLEQLITTRRPRASLVLIDDADALFAGGVSFDKTLLALAGRRTALVIVSLDDIGHSETLLELARRRSSVRIVNARFFDAHEQTAIVASAFPTLTADEIAHCLVPDVRQSLLNAQLGAAAAYRHRRRDYTLRLFDACNVLLGINGELGASAHRIERALDDDVTTIVFGNAARTADRDVCAAAFVTEELARFDTTRFDWFFDVSANDRATLAPSSLALALGTARLRAWRRALPGGAHGKLSYGGRALGGQHSKLAGERAPWRHRALVDVRTDELTNGRQLVLTREPAVGRTWRADDCEALFYRAVIRSKGAICSPHFDYDHALAAAKKKKKQKLETTPTPEVV